MRNSPEVGSVAKATPSRRIFNLHFKSWARDMKYFLHICCFLFSLLLLLLLFVRNRFVNKTKSFRTFSFFSQSSVPIGCFCGNIKYILCFLDMQYLPYRLSSNITYNTYHWHLHCLNDVWPCLATSPRNTRVVINRVLATIYIMKSCKSKFPIAIYHTDVTCHVTLGTTYHDHECLWRHSCSGFLISQGTRIPHLLNILKK